MGLKVSNGAYMPGLFSKCSEWILIQFLRFPTYYLNHLLGSVQNKDRSFLEINKVLINKKSPCGPWRLRIDWMSMYHNLSVKILLVASMGVHVLLSDST